MCESREGESFCEGNKKARSARKISRCARNDGMGGWITHVPYKGYVGKTPLPQRHPERSRGIFLAGRDNVVCVIAENGNPSAKEARKSRVQGRFLAALEMTAGGNEFISRSVQRICLESAIPVSLSRAKSRALSCRRG